jgi:hypothetical protein
LGHRAGHDGDRRRPGAWAVGDSSSGVSSSRTCSTSSSPKRSPASSLSGTHLLAYNSDFDSAKAIAIALTRPENALVFGGYTAVALLVRTVLLYSRDTD